MGIVYETASRNGERSERVWRPYHLELQGQSWLVIAHDSLRGVVRDFIVDRIVSAELLDERYDIPADFDLEQYRRSGWAVLRVTCGADARCGRKVVLPPVQPARHRAPERLPRSSPL